MALLHLVEEIALEARHHLEAKAVVVGLALGELARPGPLDAPEVAIWTTTTRPEGGTDCDRHSRIT